MKFKSYSDIENSYRTKTVDMIVEMGLASKEVEWCVTEKVHGSNYSIWYDGIDIRAAKRSCLIDDDDNFNGNRKVLPENKNKVIAIYKELNLTPGSDVLTVFGEIFGGNYPHPNVPKNKYAVKVQDGIYYSPDNLFYAFDIKVNDNYLNKKKAIKLFETNNIFHSKFLMLGTLKECMEYTNEFKSKIPQWLGLPELECDNICEGTVIAPIESKVFGCGSRVILKNKNEKWSEKSDKSKAPKLPKEEITLSDEGNRLIEEFASYVCENRLRNVISKVGDVTQKDFGKLLGLLSVDALKDFKKDHEDAYNALPKDDQNAINKRANTLSQVLIRANFVNILDKNF